MRLIIYLLAMLTGFSAAEAARPAIATPAQVDAAVGQAYASAAIDCADQQLEQVALSSCFPAVPPAEASVARSFLLRLASTPVSRYDLILG